MALNRDETMTEQSTALTADLPALDKQMLEHSQHWVLSGMHMYCIDCKIGQKASEGNQLFVHDSCCLRFAEKHYPWQDLACILHWVPSQNVVKMKPSD